MSRRSWLAPLTIALLAVAWAAPKGTAPRSSATEYAAHAQHDGVDIGVRLLRPAEVRKTFVADVNRCCVVVEVAVFPKADKPFAVSVDDLTLRVAGKDNIAKASSATVVSASLRKDAQKKRDVTVAPSVNVGYQSGSAYDPYSGTVRGGGVYTGVGVGVGVGPRINQSGASEKDRAVMETELTEKGLPEGEFASPVAGYIYFEISRGKDAKYQLEYKVNGNLVRIELK